MNGIEEIILLTENIHWLTKDQAWHYKVLPKHKASDFCVLYCEEGVNEDILAAELELLLNLQVRLEPIPAAQIARLLSKYYIKENAAQGSSQMHINNADENCFYEVKYQLK